MELIKIDEVEVKKYGTRNPHIPVPSMFVKDNELQVGDVLPVFRAVINGDDVIIISSKIVNRNLNKVG